MGGSAKYRAAHIVQTGQPQAKTFRDKINDAQTKNDLLLELQNEYGAKKVKSDFVLKNDINMVKRAMNTVIDLEEKYPFMKGFVNFFYESKAGMASMNPRGGLSLNSKYWKQDDKRMYSGKHRGWWPPNSKPESLIAHEFGHAIAFKYYNKLYKEAKRNNDLGTILSLVAGQRKGEFLKSVEKTAMKSLNVKTMKGARQQISGYATKGGIHEAFAESFADVFANGDNASDMSKAYVRELLAVIK